MWLTMAPPTRMQDFLSPPPNKSFLLTEYLISFCLWSTWWNLDLNPQSLNFHSAFPLDSSSQENPEGVIGGCWAGLAMQMQLDCRLLGPRQALLPAVPGGNACPEHQLTLNPAGFESQLHPSSCVGFHSIITSLSLSSPTRKMGVVILP